MKKKEVKEILLPFNARLFYVILDPTVKVIVAMQLDQQTPTKNRLKCNFPITETGEFTITALPQSNTPWRISYTFKRGELFLFEETVALGPRQQFNQTFKIIVR